MSRLMSQGATPQVPPRYSAPVPTSYSDDDYSDTSSDSETDSDAEAVRQAQTKKKVIKKKRQVVDAKTYNKEQAAAEWRNATSTGGPAAGKEAALPVKKPTPVASTEKVVGPTPTTTQRSDNSSGVQKTGRLVEAASEMARWFTTSETSTLRLDDDLTVEQPVSNNTLPRAGRLAKGKEYDAAPMSAATLISVAADKPYKKKVRLQRKDGDESREAHELEEEEVLLVQVSEAAANYKLGSYAQEEEVIKSPTGGGGSSTIPEEGKQRVSRADFLSMLDLLGEDNDPSTAVTTGKKDTKKATTKTKEDLPSSVTSSATVGILSSGTSVAGMERSDTTGSTTSSSGVGSSSKKVHVDVFNWEVEKRQTNEEQRLVLKAEEKKANDLLHSGKGPTKSSTVGVQRGDGSSTQDETTFNPAAAFEAYNQAQATTRMEVEQMYDFQNTLEVFELVLTGKELNRKINDYLEAHHKHFMASATLRAQGEFSHHEFNVFSIYSEQVQEWTVAEMRKRLSRQQGTTAAGKFNVETFVTELFDQEQARLDLQGDLEDELAEMGLDVSSVPEVGSASLLTLEAWEVLLSLLQFDNFASLMDEFIEAFYGVEDRDERKAGSAASLIKSSTSSSFKIPNTTSPPPQSSLAPASKAPPLATSSTTRASSKPKLSGLGSNVLSTSKLASSLVGATRSAATPPATALGPVRGKSLVGVGPSGGGGAPRMPTNPSSMLGQRSSATPPGRSSITGTGLPVGGPTKGLREVRNLPKP